MTNPETITNLHRRAFGPEEGDTIADLTKALLAEPGTLSISAERDGTVAGNVLFTPFTFTNHPEVTCYLLAPLGVLPEYQRSGVGREVMQSGIAHLKSIGADAVFVLGIPSYYPQHGFVPTDRETPYPDLLTIPESWMVLELTAGTVARLNGPTTAVPPFMQPLFWDTSMYD